MRKTYLFLAVLGAIVPYVLFGPLLLEGAGIDVWMEQLLTDPAPRGLTGDLTLSALVFLVWSFRESRRVGVRRWWVYPALTFTVGLSCGLPLFLWAREARLDG